MVGAPGSDRKGDWAYKKGSAFRRASRLAGFISGLTQRTPNVQRCSLTGFLVSAGTQACVHQRKILVQEVEELKVISKQDFEDIARIYQSYSSAQINFANIRAAALEHCVLVSRLNGPRTRKIIGFVTLLIYRRMKGLVAQVEDIVVDEKYWRRGVGSKLLAECVRRARNAGCADVHLVTYPNLEAANQLYQTAGWTKLDTNTYKVFL
jgi:ribosomal protein S18 acetylase RimI-like enzyme